MNVVADHKDVGSAVLIRAVVPLGGIDMMKEARNKDDIKQLCNGPGKLAQAFGIDKTLYGVDLRNSDVLSIWDDGCVLEVKTTPRIGISKGVDKMWRFVAAHNTYISKSPLNKLLKEQR